MTEGVRQLLRRALPPARARPGRPAGGRRRRSAGGRRGSVVRRDGGRAARPAAELPAERRGTARVGGRRRGAPPRAALAVPVAAGSELLGALAGAEQPWREDGDELLRAVANQLAVALEKAELIERLTAENIVRDLFAALAEERRDVADARARRLGADLERPHVVLEARPPARRHSRTAPTGAGARAAPARPARCSTPTGAASARSCRRRRRGRRVARARRPAGPARPGVRRRVGGSTARRGAAESAGVREARDAALVAQRLLDGGGVLPTATRRLPLPRPTAARRRPAGRAARRRRAPRRVRRRPKHPAARHARALSGQRAQPHDVRARAERPRQHAAPAPGPHRVAHGARSGDRGPAGSAAGDQARAPASGSASRSVRCGACRSRARSPASTSS